MGAEDGGNIGKLRGGVRVIILHPEWDRPCSVCEKYVTRADGSFLLDRRTSLPVLRQPGTPTPCHKCEKVPLYLRREGADQEVLRAAAIELTEQNRKAWEFYRQCRAAGSFPDDPLVRHFAVVFREVEDELERMPVLRLASTVQLLVELLAKRR